VQGIICLVYLDDIVIYGSSLQEHNKRLTEVLQRLRKHNLKLQVEKCAFLRKEVTYLGHIISEDGILPDPAKVSAVKDFPIPKKVKDPILYRTSWILPEIYKKLFQNCQTSNN